MFTGIQLNSFALGRMVLCVLVGTTLHAQEPLLPGAQALTDDSTLLLLPDGAGYFPTEGEFPLLRGAANSRTGGVDGNIGPDLRMQTATDLFPYEEPVPNFYQRHPHIFRNLDHLLGIFTPNDAWTIESQEMRNKSLTLDANTGLLTRSFSPDLATVKLGPLYFDLLWVGAGAIWSDFNGRQTFPPDGGDGVISYVDLGFRALFRFTDTIYLSAAGQLMYLPQSNEIAFGLGYGNQASIGIDLFFGDTWGEWDVSFTSAFFGRPGLNFYADTWNDGFDRAGRYWFGFQQRRANPTQQFANDGRGALFGNTVAFNASRLVLGGAWRFWSRLSHTDFWQGFDFDNHGKREQLSLLLGYEGSILPFAPRFSYDMWSFDGFESLFHQFMVGLTGRLTENINWASNVGYLFGTGGANSQGRFLWNMSLQHNITARTNHWLSFGEMFFANDVADEAITTRYLGYGLTHNFARNLHFSIFGQISDREDVLHGRRGGFDASERAGGGAILTYKPLDFTAISASIMHDTSLKPTDLYTRWLSRIQITQQLSMRLTGTLMYQYEESSGRAAGFTEHMVQLGLRRYF
ncbi:MAG: hypothetical protein HS117_19025 [Verrucomicrobiaceae bacterium]|nr:hypothetical protein [Verrucomicrobiaceae bacterium]